MCKRLAALTLTAIMLWTNALGVVPVRADDGQPPTAATDEVHEEVVVTETGREMHTLSATTTVNGPRSGPQAQTLNSQSASLAALIYWEQCPPNIMCVPTYQSLKGGARLILTGSPTGKAWVIFSKNSQELGDTTDTPCWTTTSCTSWTYTQCCADSAWAGDTALSLAKADIYWSGSGSGDPYPMYNTVTKRF